MMLHSLLAEFFRQAPALFYPDHFIHGAMDQQHRDAPGIYKANAAGGIILGLLFRGCPAQILPEQFVGIQNVVWVGIGPCEI